MGGTRPSLVRHLGLRSLETRYVRETCFWRGLAVPREGTSFGGSNFARYFHREYVGSVAIRTDDLQRYGFPERLRGTASPHCDLGRYMAMPGRRILPSRRTSK